MPEALWLTEKNGVFRLGPAPEPTPGPKQIVVRARAIAVNPVDRYLPQIGGLITPWLAYPAVVGSDVAGEVAAVGAEVTRFKPGDRVVGLGAGADKGHTSAEGAFQELVVVQQHMAAAIPDSLAFEHAAVLPLGLCTAASGLFQQDYSALRHPTFPPAAPSGEVVLVWGGSTSVGSNAIQLAKAAGYEVITTCGARNFDYVKSLGAAAAFDYASPTVVRDIIAAVAGRTVAGALAIGTGSTSALLDIVAACPGRRFISLASQPASFDDLPAGRIGPLQLAPALARLAAGNAALALKTARAGAKTKFIWGTTLQDNEVGPMIFETFLPAALAAGHYKPAPDPVIAGQGVGAIPAALDLLGKGVSAKKVVVTL